MIKEIQWKIGRNETSEMERMLWYQYNSNSVKQEEYIDAEDDEGSERAVS